MNTKRQIEESLRRDLKAVTPDYFNKISNKTSDVGIESVGDTLIMKKSAKKIIAGSVMGFICLALIGVLLFFFLFPFIRYNSVNYLTVDINPSVQLILNEKGKVVKVKPLNYDAQIMLSGKLNAFDHLDAQAAGAKLVDYAFDYGYFKPEQKNNAMLVSLTLKDVKSENKMLNKIEKSVEDKFIRYGVYGLCLTDINKGGLKEEAAAYGITESKLRFIRDAVSMGVKIGEAEYQTVSVSEIYKRLEELSDKLEAFVDKDLMEELEELEEQAEERLEGFTETIEEKLEELEDIGDEFEPIQEKLSEILEIIEDESGDIRTHLQRLESAVRDAATDNDEVNALLEEIALEIAQFIGLFEGGDLKKAEAKAKLLQKEAELKSKNSENLKNHVKDKDFDKEYKKWRESADKDYYDNWDTRKKSWEDSRA